MTEFTEKKPDDKTFQLSGTFCFYSKVRGPEYGTSAIRLGEGPVAVNYFGSMLSDGTPGGLAGDTLVRPDQADTYVLVGKVVPNTGHQTFLEPIDLAAEVAQQLGLPPVEEKKPVVAPPVPAARNPAEKKEQDKIQRRAYDQEILKKFKLNLGNKK